MKEYVSRKTLIRLFFSSLVIQVLLACSPTFKAQEPSQGTDASTLHHTDPPKEVPDPPEHGRVDPIPPPNPVPPPPPDSKPPALKLPDCLAGEVCVQNIMSLTYGTCAGLSNGQYKCWGMPFPRDGAEVIAGIPANVHQIGGHTFTYSFLTDEGKLYVVNNPEGQNPVVPHLALQNIKSLAPDSAGTNWRSCAINNLGQLFCAHLYKTDSGYAVHPWAMEDTSSLKVKKISLSEMHIGILLESDVLLVRELQKGGALKSTTANIVRFSETYQDFGVSTKGVYLIGKDTNTSVFLQPANGSPQKIGELGAAYGSLTVGSMHICVLPKADAPTAGQPKCFGNIVDESGSFDMTRVNESGIVQMSSSYYNSCFLKVDHKVICSGVNKRGSLGSSLVGSSPHVEALN